MKNIAHIQEPNISFGDLSLRGAIKEALVHATQSLTNAQFREAFVPESCPVLVHATQLVAA